jgi:WD40 repeat protein
LTVWDLDKGIPLCRLTGHDYDIIDWDLTVDGDYVVTASWDKTLKVYDYRNGKEIHTLRGHNQRINSLSLTSDGHKVLSAGEDQILMLWNIPKGERIFSLWGHTDEVSAAVFTPDGKHAISISYDHTFRVWDLETRKEQHEISHSYINVEEIILTPDGKQVIIREGDGTLSIGSEDFAIKVWELETGCLIHTLPGHTNLVIDILVTQDGRYIISTSHDHSLRIWDLKNGQTVARFMGEDNLNIQAISPDGKTILAQGEKGQVHFLQLEEFDFGPAIVTARRLQKPSGVFKLRKPQSDLSVTCIQCNAEFDVDDSKLGGEIYCHACGRLLHLNQTTL